MPAHLSTPTRRRRAGALLIAIGVAVIGFTLVDEDPRPEVRTASEDWAPADTSPTVLGAVVTRDGVVTAPPAAPATFELADDSGDGPRRSTTTSTTRPSSTTTYPPPTLGPPWSIVRDPDETTTSTTAPTTTTPTTETTETTETTTSTNTSTTDTTTTTAE